MLSIDETPLSPRSQIGGCGTRELIGAVGAIELAVANEVRLDALRHALQTPGNVLVLSWHVQGWAKKVGPRLREFFRKVEAEVVSNSRNKIYQIWGLPFSPTLHIST